jgi:hypothetical protein
MKTQQNKRIIVFLIIIYSINMDIFPQSEFIPIKKLHQDVKFYFNTIKEVHPDPYFFTPKEILDSAKTKILQTINRPMTSWELAKIIEFETNSLFDNHTKMHYVFYHAEKNVSFFDTCFFFPWHVNVHKGDVNLRYLDASYKVISINQHSIEEIKKKLLKIYSADISENEKQMDIGIYFSLYYCLIYPNEQNFDVKLFDSQGNVKEINSQGIPFKSVLEYIKKQVSTQIETNFHIDFYEDTIALMTINTFELLHDNHLYTNFLEESFRKIAEKHCNYLFIDIKSNGGGSSRNVFVLLDYLFEENYSFLGCFSVKKRSRSYIKEYEDKIERKKNKYLDMVLDYSFFQRTNAVQYPFAGTLFLIQGYGTQSASLDLSAAIKSSRRGILLGKPTGEPACSFSQGIVFNLPNSNLTFQCATSFFAMPSGDSDNQWIKPDIEVEIHQEPIDIETLHLWIELARNKYPSFFICPN